MEVKVRDSKIHHIALAGELQLAGSSLQDDLGILLVVEALGIYCLEKCNGLCETCL